MRVVRGKAVNAELRKLAKYGDNSGLRVERAVRRILRDVRENGDAALRIYAERWDGLRQRQPLRLSRKALGKALDTAPPDFLAALQRAAKNIRRFCEWQKPVPFRKEIEPGLSVGQIIRPLQSVGCYVPGGRYPLPSSLLMTVIPAQVAGVERIVVVSPKPATATMAAAALLGVSEFYAFGGAQAIAALAYGTRTVTRVDKIVGPGNTYVTTAKRLVAFDCAIDMVAGPTEALVIRDEGNPAFIAADLVSQAEHDPDAVPVFVTTSEALAVEVLSEVRRRSADNPIAQQSLESNGIVFIAGSKDQAWQIANTLAPEHITAAPDELDRIRSAGSVFLGDYSPQALGDYASGPNHVLPTAGAARFRGGLSVSDFLKVITVQEVSSKALRRIAPVVEALAVTEGLQAHAQSVRTRYSRA
jgi:histidinol dehydrogenase